MALETFSTARPAARTDGYRTIRTRAAQGLMLFVGIVATFGFSYFTMIEPEEGMGLGDGLVAATLLIGSLGYIATSRKLGVMDRDIWAAAIGFAVLRTALSLVKVFGYDEGEATLFLALDFVILGLVFTLRPADATRFRP